MMKSNSFLCSSAARAFLAAGVIAAASFRAFAGDQTPDDKLAKSVIEPEEPSRLHLLLQVEATSHYITPRGLDVVYSGASFQPLTVVMFDAYRSQTNWLSNVQLWGSYWNDVGTSKYGAVPGYWNEIDFAGGVDFKFLKGFDLNISYSSFHSETESYSTNGHLEVTLAYHDSFMGPFSINPNVWYFQDLHKEATVQFNYTTAKRGFYFAPGIDPTYKFDPFPLTVELPTYVTLVSPSFYQKFDGSEGGSGVGVFSTGYKFSVPLKFIPHSYGSWTVYTGFQYYYVQNQGALDGNEFALTGKKYEQRDLYRFYGGVSIFF
jgi:hypothetical protein